MDRYTMKYDDDLRLGSAPELPTEEFATGNAPRAWLAVLNERMHHMSTSVRELAARQSVFEDNLADLRRRLAVVEERLSHTATKSWVLGCAVAVLAAGLAGTLGGFWWILQQYIGPLLRASAG